jgi:hypothetical protein
MVVAPDPGLQPPEQAAFERLVADNYASLRTDLPDRPDELLQLAANILAEGTRRRLNGTSSDTEDQQDIARLQSLFWPEAGTSTAGSPSMVFQ